MKIIDLRIECKSTLKKTSKDDSNNYMTNSDLQVIDFDCLKDKYTGKIEFKGVGIKSNDALFIQDENYVFIEFKNGKLDSAIHFNVAGEEDIKLKFKNNNFEFELNENKNSGIQMELIENSEMISSEFSIQS